MVDFPKPEAPTRAVLVLEFRVRLRLERMRASGRDGYVKLTDSKAIRPGLERRTCPECS